MSCPFAALGLLPTFGLTPAVLERAYYQALQNHHPDRTGAALSGTAINAAYQQLKDPLQRAQVLLQQAGVDLSTQAQTYLTPTVLEALFTQREALAEATTSAEHQAVQQAVQQAEATWWPTLEKALASNDYPAAARALVALQSWASLKRDLAAAPTAEAPHA